ncbi:kinase-like domain-containing protein [Thelephora terrestris]|uniref:Kinase-like domain-containing protein n=1 Tax=Thelephora terrestris TaxID=56493 RepID=A0A9P6HKG0_9AGAM|nr:kinase-like domain-containing protein [Thelephora terrestris]
MDIQPLYELDKSSPQFPEQLIQLLRNEQWMASLQSSPEGELGKLIGYLDNILDGLNPAEQPQAFGRCLRTLRKICGSNKILPLTYEISGKLSFNSDYAVAFGGFCDAYTGSLGPDKVCIKRLRVSSTGDQELVKKSLCKEAVVWKHLDHPNIVPFKGITFEPLQLASEWIPGGELKEYIRRNPDANLISLLLGVAKGLGYLHSCKLIHGDLKGANILVDAVGNPRIVDFGLATIARDSKSLETTNDHQATTLRFTAPELLQARAPHSNESDIFAFGMVVIEVFTGKVPFSKFISYAAMANIMNGVRPERPLHPGLTDDLWTLTRKCWEENPQDRPQIDSVVTHLSACQVPQSTWTQTAGLPRGEMSQASSPTLSPSGVTPFFLFPPSPSSPTYFFGRDTIFEDLLSFAERSVSVTLYGAGGMGKTAIALKLLHHSRIINRFGARRYFMRCGDLEDSLESFLGRLSETLGVPLAMDVAQLRSNVEASPCVLVLDGMDSIIDPRAHGAAEIAKAIEELGQCPKVCLLATSRMDAKVPDFRRMEVSTFPEEAARDTFHSHCSLERSPAVYNILAELDFHPLSIVLLANAVSENRWDESALLKAWVGRKTCILMASGYGSLETYIESALRTSTIQALGTAARETLEAISNHPDGVQEFQLSKIYPEKDRMGDAVNALCKFSLMYRQDGFVKMHSPFRLYFQDTRLTTNLVPEVQPSEVHSVTPDGENPAKSSGISFTLRRIRLRLGSIINTGSRKKSLTPFAPQESTNPTTRKVDVRTSSPPPSTFAAPTGFAK